MRWPGGHGAGANHRRIRQSMCWGYLFLEHTSIISAQQPEWMRQDGGASLGCNHGRLPDFTPRCQWRVAGLAPYRNFYFSSFPLISKKCYHHDEITVADLGVLQLRKNVCGFRTGRPYFSIKLSLIEYN